MITSVTPDPFQRVDVGAVGHGGGRMDVSASVAGQERHVDTL